MRKITRLVLPAAMVIGTLGTAVVASTATCVPSLTTTAHTTAVTTAVGSIGTDELPPGEYIRPHLAG
jgi:hypothetical protein